MNYFRRIVLDELSTNSFLSAALKNYFSYTHSAVQVMLVIFVQRQLIVLVFDTEDTIFYTVRTSA